VACVTSNLDAKPYTILITNKDMEDGAILRDSYIRADKISTISQGLVVRRVGRVKPEIIEKVKEKIMSLMDDNK
jgi:mRNA interferase MazF